MNDTQHGKGKYKFLDGLKYEGDWVYNKIHGKGTLILLDG